MTIRAWLSQTVLPQLWGEDQEFFPLPPTGPINRPAPVYADKQSPCPPQLILLTHQHPGLNPAVHVLAQWLFQKNTCSLYSSPWYTTKEHVLLLDIPKHTQLWYGTHVEEESQHSN
ncbi:rCG20193 [Rattus norvegicus]|uniref:RCG20193 n=1 Tax=Rattus norvegicus TaxID=10116 RepID=A6JH34_RAT|nr:rCG20193 [Rattus norvegicus]